LTEQNSANLDVVNVVRWTAAALMRLGPDQTARLVALAGAVLAC
jgi:hypothetical protein